MIKYLIVISLLFFLQFPFHITGKYKVEFDKKYYPNNEANFTIDFAEKNYTKSDSIQGGITRIYKKDSKTIIHLQDFVFIQPKLENNMKPKGKLVIEFEESDLDTIQFRTTYTKQLETTIHTGKLIKIK